MPRTKTFGVRLPPELILELDRLKSAFSFSNYAEMMQIFVRVLQSIDHSISEIEDHPSNWDATDIERHVPVLAHSYASTGVDEIDGLMWRRLKERFGQDGVERIRELIDGEFSESY